MSTKAGLGNVLVLGYGNPGRMDDGLGPAFAEAVGGMGLPGVRAEANYQLTVEDAALAAEHEFVIFADAAVSGPEPFSLQPVRISADIAFSSHILAPENIMTMAYTLFKAQPAAYTLAIRGYRFDEFGEVLSAGAMRNLTSALMMIRPAIESRTFTAGLESGLMRSTAMNQGLPGTNKVRLT